MEKMAVLDVGDCCFLGILGLIKIRAFMWFGDLNRLGALPGELDELGLSPR
jgi:hypothetical protein